jgi:phosphoribosylaminoimidazole-succinocarboxamide synthase
MISNIVEPVITQTNFPGMKLKNRGKVRDIYDFGEALLIVATDRISAFDVVMNEGIPYKGKVLTQISDFWFEQTKDIIPNHLIHPSFTISLQHASPIGIRLATARCL